MEPSDELERLTRINKVLQSALGIDIDGVDWNGTWEDAEQKLQLTIPLITSNDAEESLAARVAAKKWSEIVNLHIKTKSGSGNGAANSEYSEDEEDDDTTIGGTPAGRWPFQDNEYPNIDPLKLAINEKRKKSLQQVEKLKNLAREIQLSAITSEGVNENSEQLALDANVEAARTQLDLVQNEVQVVQKQLDRSKNELAIMNGKKFENVSETDLEKRIVDLEELAKTYNEELTALQRDFKENQEGLQQELLEDEEVFGNNSNYLVSEKNIQQDDIEASLDESLEEARNFLSSLMGSGSNSEEDDKAIDKNELNNELNNQKMEETEPESENKAGSLPKPEPLHADSDSAAASTYNELLHRAETESRHWRHEAEYYNRLLRYQVKEYEKANIDALASGSQIENLKKKLEMMSLRRRSLQKKVNNMKKNGHEQFIYELELESEITKLRKKLRALKKANKSIKDVVKNDPGIGNRGQLKTQLNRGSDELAFLRKQVESLSKQLNNIMNLQRNMTLRRVPAVQRNSSAKGVYPDESFADVKSFGDVTKSIKRFFDLKIRYSADWNGTLDCAEENIREHLPKMANNSDDKESLEAQLELWVKLVKTQKEFKKREQEKWEVWEKQNKGLNQDAYDQIRNLITVDSLQQVNLEDLVQSGMNKKLAKRILDEKPLELLLMSKQDIANVSFRDLISFYIPKGLDLVELRAIYHCLPEAFEDDPDGKKEQWRLHIRDTLFEYIEKDSKGKLKNNLKRNSAYTSSNSVTKSISKTLKRTLGKS